MTFRSQHLAPSPVRLNTLLRSFSLLFAVLLAACSDESPTGVAVPDRSAPDYFVAGGNAPTFSDDFAGTALDTGKWTLLGTAARVNVDNRLAITLAPNTIEATKLRYRLPDNFQGRSFNVEVSQYATGSSTLGTFAAVTDVNELSYVIFNAFAGQLSAWYRWNGQNPVQLGSIALDPVAHRFLRLREASGVAYYETSPNGTTWTVRWTVSHAFSNLTQLHGMVGLQAWGSPGSNPTPAIFENVNTFVPATPRDLSTSAGVPLAIQLAWQDRSVNETGFQIERRIAGSGEFEALVTVPANATTYSDQGLVAGTTYEYRVRGASTAGVSAWSASASATVAAEPPPPPPGVGSVGDDFAGTVLNLDKWEIIGPTNRVVLDNRMELATTPGVNEHVMVRQRLPRSFIGDAFFAEISEWSQGTSTTETFIGVIAEDQEEYVIISAWGGQLTGWYKWRDQAFVQLPGSLPLDPVAHRFLRLREQGGVAYYETSPNGLTWTTRWTTVTNFVDPNDLHGYTGVGTWGTPNSNPTPAVFENVNVRIPAAPRSPAATATGPFRIDLTWQDRSVTETGFSIERRVAGVGAFQAVASVGPNVTTYANSGLADGTTYEYRVRAIGAEGASAASAAASATAEGEPAPPPPPAMATITDTFAGSVLDADRWEVFATAGRVTVDNRLQLTIGAGVVEDTRIRYRLSRNLQGSTFQTEVSQFAGGSSAIQTIVAVANGDATSQANFRVSGGQLTAWYRWNGQSAVQLAGPLTLDATAHRYLRIREASGVVYYETSSNGSSWTVRWNVTHAFPDVHNLHGTLAVLSGGSATATPTPALFENVNTLVPASPRALAASSGVPLTIQVTWEDRSANETGFQLQRRVAGSGSFQTIVTTAANATSYQDTGLTGGTTYEYRIRASGAAGVSEFPGSASALASSPPPPPALSGLVDDFAGTSLDAEKWVVTAPPGRVTVANRLQVSIAANTVQALKVMTQTPRTFQGSSFQTEISQYASGSATIGTFMAVTDAAEQSFVIFNAFNGQLTAWYRWNGASPVQLGSIPLSAVNHRFLRLREANGTVYYETSADNQMWAVRWTVARNFPNVNSLHGMLGVQAWGAPGANPVAAYFEGVNIKP